MAKYRPVSDVQVSPDGKRVAFVVRETVMESDKSEYRTQIWLASTDGKESRQVTFADQASSRPRWSPDGKWIAFISKRGDRYANVWLLPDRGRRGVAADRRRSRTSPSRPGRPTASRSPSSPPSRRPTTRSGATGRGTTRGSWAGTTGPGASG